jgi:hypothetical protein
MRRMTLRAALLAAAIPMILGSPAGGQSVEVIDFEDYPTGRDIDPAFYIDRGIRFEGGTVLEYEEGFASSGRNGLEMCYSEEFCTTPFRIRFVSAQRNVSVFVGYSGRLAEAPPVLMVAFDADGQRLFDNDVVLEPGSPVPVRHVLEVHDPEGRILAVEIRWSDARRLMKFLVIDDVTFELILPLVLVSDPSELVLESESSGEIVVTNNGKGAVSFTVGLADDTGAFELLDTTCGARLAAGESCTLVVGFGSLAPGEFTAAAVLLDPNGEQLFAIPLIGHEAPVETTTTSPSTTSTITSSTSTTTSSTSTTTFSSSTTTFSASTTTSPTSTATASSSTATSSAVVPTTQPGSNITTGEGPTREVQLLATSIVVAIGGVFLLATLRSRRAKTGARHLESTTQINATVRVIPDQGSHQITTDNRRPVTAIRIVTDPGGVTTTLMEVKSS